MQNFALSFEAVVRRGCLVLLILAGLAVVAMPATASAATFTVDDTGDTSDANTADGICDDGSGHCTLRAAVEQANDLPGADKVGFIPALQNNNTTIGVSSTEIDIYEPLAINGCSGLPDAKNPCVGVDLNGFSFGVLNNASNVAIRGLAITDSAPGAIYAPAGSDGLQVQNNWFGIAIGGNDAATGTSIDLRADGATIGGPSRKDRNVFANANGVYLASGDDNTIAGNLFGTEPDGITADNTSTLYTINIVGANSDAPTGNVVGGTLSKKQASTSKCDGPCNVIAGANSTLNSAGINFAASPAAQNTTIAGNFVGLDTTGAASGPDLYNAYGIRNFGFAQNTTIGGPSKRVRNVIAYSGAGIYDGSGSVHLEGNFIGLDSTGANRLTGSNAGFGALVSGSATVEISRNRLAGGDQATLLAGYGAGGTITGNTTGIGTDGSDVGGGYYGVSLSNPGGGWTVGGTTQGTANTIGNAAHAGLRISGSDGNTVIGNLIGADAAGTDQGNGDEGVRLDLGGGPTSPDNNHIGGNSVESENVISNNGTDAIHLEGDGTGNLFLRNRGHANGSLPTDLFIDILPDDGFGNTGIANGGIENPTIISATPTHAAGTGEPDATVRLFLTKSPDSSNPNRIESFVKKTTADGTGNWAASYPALPPNKRLTASQTTSSDGTSELSPAKSY